MISDLTQADIESFFLAYDIFFDFLGIFISSFAQHRFQRRNHLTVADLARPYYYFAVFYPAGSFDNGMIPLGYAAECGIKIIYFTCFFESYTYNCWHYLSSFRSMSVLSTTVSKTSLAPALLSMA